MYHRLEFPPSLLRSYPSSHSRTESPHFFASDDEGYGDEDTAAIDAALSAASSHDEAVSELEKRIAALEAKDRASSEKMAKLEARLVLARSRAKR